MTVRHEYLFGVLRMHDLETEFIDFFREIYRDISSTLVLNGVPKGTIGLGRGVPQGCALSPMLFALCTNPFIRSISPDLKVRGLPLLGKSAITGSAYADDVPMFIRDQTVCFKC